MEKEKTKRINGRTAEVGFYLNCTNNGQDYEFIMIVYGMIAYNVKLFFQASSVFPPLPWQRAAAAIECGRSALNKNT